MKRLAVASVVGTALEYYDFAVYNTLAALVFNQVFFPTVDPLSGALFAFATFWVGYLSRPVGGLLFGHLGDRRGRRFVLVITLLVMGLTTLAIGLLPGYAQIGVLAPILLVSLRFVQGMALGGEWAGAVLLTMEHGSDDQRGRNASFAQMGPAIGVLLATLSIALVTWLYTPEELMSYAWRIPLLASALLVGFGLWVRRSVPESPQFQDVDQVSHRAPLRELVRDHWRGLVLAGAVRVGPDVLYSLLSVFVLMYLTTVLGLSRTLVTVATAIGMAICACMIYVAGRLSDQRGRRLVYGAATLATLAWLWLLFPLLDTKAEWAVVLVFVSGLSLHAFMYGPQAAFIAEQFPTHVRYAGASLAYTFAGVFAGGLAPFAFTALYKAWGDTRVIVLYTSAAMLVTLLALALARPRAGRPGRDAHTRTTSSSS
jgi:MFS family permease